MKFEPEEPVMIINAGSTLLGEFVMQMGEDCVVIVNGKRRWFKLSQLEKAHA